MVLKLILIFIMLYAFVYMPYLNSNNKSVHVVPIYSSSYYEPITHRYGYYSYPRIYTHNVGHGNVHHYGSKTRRHYGSKTRRHYGSKTRHNKHH